VVPEHRFSNLPFYEFPKRLNSEDNVKTAFLKRPTCRPDSNDYWTCGAHGNTGSFSRSTKYMQKDSTRVWLIGTENQYTQLQGIGGVDCHHMKPALHG
jgi:hypothetical protein